MDGLSGLWRSHLRSFIFFFLFFFFLFFFFRRALPLPSSDKKIEPLGSNFRVIFPLAYIPLPISLQFRARKNRGICSLYDSLLAEKCRNETFYHHGQSYFYITFVTLRIHGVRVKGRICASKNELRFRWTRFNLKYIGIQSSRSNRNNYNHGLLDKMVARVSLTFQCQYRKR